MAGTCGMRLRDFPMVCVIEDGPGIAVKDVGGADVKGGGDPCHEELGEGDDAAEMEGAYAGLHEMGAVPGPRGDGEAADYEEDAGGEDEPGVWIIPRHRARDPLIGGSTGGRRLGGAGRRDETGCARAMRAGAGFWGNHVRQVAAREGRNKGKTKIGWLWKF